MATFDAARLDPSQYTLGIPSHVLRLQATVEAFMDLVRTNPAYVKVNKQLIVDFCRLIDHDKSFPLAAMVVPELQLPQSYDTTAKTVINVILRKAEIKRRRPAPAIINTGNIEEKRLVRQQIRSIMEYLTYDQGREDEAEEAEREQVEFDVARATDIISKC